MSVEIVNGTVAFGASTFTTSAGDNNNVPVSAAYLIVTTSNNNDALTGFVPFTSDSGQLLFVVNLHETNNLILKPDNAGSDVENRIRTSTGTNLTLAPYQAALLTYSSQGRIGWNLFTQGTLA